MVFLLVAKPGGEVDVSPLLDERHIAYDMSMRQFIRRGFILLLLVLQGVAPLLHAHVRAVDSALGIHLPEFETLSAPRADAAMQAAALHGVVTDGAWAGVTMGLISPQTNESARAQPPSQHTSAITGTLGLDRHQPLSEPIVISPFFDPPVPSTFLHRAAAPRAPPLLPCSA